MPIREKTLRVYPNPWTYIDHLGRPAGTVRLDPLEHSPNRAWVGAQIAEAKLTQAPFTEVIRGKGFTSGTGQHELTWAFVSPPDEPVSLPNTGYYRQNVLEGSLIAADERTSRECGLQGFVSPEVVLAAAKSAAIADFDAHNGAGAFASLNAVSDVPAPALEPAPTTKPTKKGDS